MYRPNSLYKPLRIHRSMGLLNFLQLKQSRYLGKRILSEPWKTSPGGLKDVIKELLSYSIPICTQNSIRFFEVLWDLQDIKNLEVHRGLQTNAFKDSTSLADTSSRHGLKIICKSTGDGLDVDDDKWPEVKQMVTTSTTCLWVIQVHLVSLCFTIAAAAACAW